MGEVLRAGIDFLEYIYFTREIGRWHLAPNVCNEPFLVIEVVSYEGWLKFTAMSAYDPEPTLFTRVFRHR